MVQKRETTRRDSSLDEWLSLGPAARLLGVSEVTLRHWADEGRVRSYRTMGSHRRFSRQELAELVQVRGGPTQREDLEGQTLQRLRRRFRNRRSTVDAPTGPIAEDDKARLRVLGRSVVELVLRYHRDRRRRSDARLEAIVIGREYGEETERMGLSASQALESFLSHRAALVETVRILAAPDSSSDGTLDLWRDIADLTDAMLIALVYVYEGPVVIPSKPFAASARRRSVAVGP